MIYHYPPAKHDGQTGKSNCAKNQMIALASVFMWLKE